MNYGYLGTRELNEALVSRFVVIELEQISEDQLALLIKEMFPKIKKLALELFIKFFKDIELKVSNSEMSSRALDLRGLLSALKSIDIGLDLRSALRISISNKTFDSFEKELIEDRKSTRLNSSH